MDVCHRWWGARTSLTRPLVRKAVGGVKGGVILFRGTGMAARRYLESDRSTADDYYLESGAAFAEFAVTDAQGVVVDERVLEPEQYAAWVDWVDPVTVTSMGVPRAAGQGSRGSPRFAEMVINAPKSLSIAAALHPDVSDALDLAQQDAAAEIRSWLAQNSVTRTGPRHAREVVPVDFLQTVQVTHRTSRAGDPHRHIHFQIGTRVHAAGKWRALDTAALFKQQGAIRALGTAVIAAHPELARVLEARGLTLDPVSGEVAQLQPFNMVMSKRARQVERNLARLEAEWEHAHPGETIGPAVRSRMLHRAWAQERPGKKPSVPASEAGWRAELAAAGYTPETSSARDRLRVVVGTDDVSIEEVASRALDRCAAGASAWTVHTIREHVTRIMTENGVTATPGQIREVVDLATGLAVSDCFSILPERVARPDHVAHYTSVRVVEAETRLRDLLTHAAPPEGVPHPAVAHLRDARGLDADQLQAAAAIASVDPLVVVEGAAGSGKTTMLSPAIIAARHAGRKTRVVTPTKKAAQVAGAALDLPSDSVAALVYSHGWRWNTDGVWTRLVPGDVDPQSGKVYAGPSRAARLERGERVVVDEAGMLDQDTAIALLTVTAEAGATVALVGDRAQLPAVGRGGVLDIAAQIRGATVDMTGLHRFTDPAYADLTLRLRDGTHPEGVFAQLQTMGLVQLHDDEESLREYLAKHTTPEDAVTVATGDEATKVNEAIQVERVARGEVDPVRTVFGSDGLDMGAGDIIQARKNNTDLRVANRETFTVQHVTRDGTVYARSTETGRKAKRVVKLTPEYVAEHAHLAYASTAYGVQGITTHTSHTVLDETIGAAGIYVGLTRGTHQNIVHLVAENPADAQEQFVQAMSRDRADRGLEAETQDALGAVRNIVTHGPIAFVNAERERLTTAISRAEQEAEKWAQASMLFAEQRSTHAAERDAQHLRVAAAEAHARQVRAVAAAPLVEAATEDGRTFLAAQQAAWDAGRDTPQSRWFSGRRAARARGEIHRAHRTLEATTTQRWGSTPHTPNALTVWAERVAREHAAILPEVVDAEQQLADAKTTASQILNRQSTETQRLRARFTDANGRLPEGGPAAHAKQWRTHADRLRGRLAEIEAVPAEEAVQIVHQQRAAAAAERTAIERARAERTRKVTPPEREIHTDARNPERGHGLGR